MTQRPKTEEQYAKGNEILNFVIYNSTIAAGEDEVLQHKISGSETAHITLHPDGSVNFRIKRTKSYLENAVRSNLQGFTPIASVRLKEFLTKIKRKL